MKTIKISDGIELVIVDDGGIALKDLFNDRSIAILPEELDAVIDSLQQAKMQRVSYKFKEILRNNNLRVCTCSGYQLEKYGCQCSFREKNLR